MCTRLVAAEFVIARKVSLIRNQMEVQIVNFLNLGTIGVQTVGLQVFP